MTGLKDITNKLHLQQSTKRCGSQFFDQNQENLCSQKAEVRSSGGVRGTVYKGLMSPQKITRSEPRESQADLLSATLFARVINSSQKKPDTLVTRLQDISEETRTFGPYHDEETRLLPPRSINGHKFLMPFGSLFPMRSLSPRAVVEDRSLSFPAVEEDRSLSFPAVVEDRSLSLPAVVEDRSLSLPAVEEDRSLSFPAVEEDRSLSLPAVEEDRSLSFPAVVEDCSLLTQDLMEDLWSDDYFALDDLPWPQGFFVLDDATLKDLTFFISSVSPNAAEKDSFLSFPAVVEDRSLLRCAAIALENCDFSTCTTVDEIPDSSTGESRSFSPASSLDEEDKAEPIDDTLIGEVALAMCFDPAAASLSDKMMSPVTKLITLMKFRQMHSINVSAEFFIDSLKSFDTFLFSADEIGWLDKLKKKLLLPDKRERLIEKMREATSRSRQAGVPNTNLSRNAKNRQQNEFRSFLDSQLGSNQMSDERRDFFKVVFCAAVLLAANDVVIDPFHQFFADKLASVQGLTRDHHQILQSTYRYLARGRHLISGRNVETNLLIPLTSLLSFQGVVRTYGGGDGALSKAMKEMYKVIFDLKKKK